jgi:hypothetical protein
MAVQRLRHYARRREAFRRIESTLNRALKTLKKLTAWRFGEKLWQSKE